MTAAYFEDHPTDPDKVILRKPKHDFGEQKPVAYWNFNSGFSHCMIDQLNEAAKKNPAPLYTTPPQRKPLTDEEIEQLIFQSGGHKTTQNLMSNPMQVREYVELWNERIYAFARAIEAAHGIKGEA